MKNFMIPEDVLQATIAYIATCPIKEALGIFNRLNSLQEVVVNPPTPPASPNPDEQKSNPE